MINSPVGSIQCAETPLKKRKSPGFPVARIQNDHLSRVGVASNQPGEWTGRSSDPGYVAQYIRRRPPRPPQMEYRRMDFSIAECFETTAMGKQASARRLHSFGVICYYLIRYPINSILPNCHLAVFRHRAFWPRPRHSTSFFAFRFFKTRRIMSALTFGHLFCSSATLKVPKALSIA